MKYLYSNRFVILFTGLILALFGSLFFPSGIYEQWIAPVVFFLNIFNGFLLVSKKRKQLLLLFVIFIYSIASFTLGPAIIKDEIVLSVFKLSGFFAFFVIVTLVVIKQVWDALEVNIDTLLGLLCGYICLGFVGFFLLTAIDIADPNSFSGLLTDASGIVLKSESFLYLSFITLLTIGYGDITPLSPLAYRATILIGILGQFYVIVITTVVLSKFIRKSGKS